MGKNMRVVVEFKNGEASDIQHVKQIIVLQDIVIIEKDFSLENIMPTKESISSMRIDF